MADYTINDAMADIRLEYDDRFIYNDVRSSIGTTSTETVVDADPTYEWRLWQEYHSLPPSGETTFRYFKATVADPIAWRLRDVTCYDYSYVPYSGFQIDLIATNEDNTKAVQLTNTGSGSGTIKYIVEYKILAADAVTHEETTYSTLTVRAYDETSILKYGRRTMNLIWPVGATEQQMQGIVDRYCEKHKDPAMRATVVMKGKDDTSRAIIFGCEVSEDVSLVCADLGLNDAFYIDSIDIAGTPDGIPVCTLGLTDKYATETHSIFIVGTSKVGSADRIG
jgi:hypothetical protein